MKEICQFTISLRLIIREDGNLTVLWTYKNGEYTGELSFGDPGKQGDLLEILKTRQFNHLIQTTASRFMEPIAEDIKKRVREYVHNQIEKGLEGKI